MNEVSVITINYNNKEGIEKTIRSVIHQEEEGEYIIVDGGSDDGSLDVIKKYDPYIDQVLVGIDNGLYDAINIGLRKATGKYVMLLHSGDTFVDSGTISFLKRKYQTHEKKSRKNNFILVGNKVVNHKVIKPKLLDGPGALINHTTWFSSRENFSKVEYDTRFKISSDLHLYYDLKTIMNVNFIHVDRSVQIFDSTGISNSKSLSTILENVKEDYRIYKQYNFSKIFSLWMTTKMFISKLVK